jgi:hypothetical protein
MKNGLSRILPLLLLALLLLPVPGLAQEGDETLELTIRRDFGYGGGTRIQGRFSMRVSGPDDLTRVEFLIDDQVVFSESEPPYRYNFSTGEFPAGVHTLSAIGYRQDGSTLQSRTWTFEFLTAEQARADIVKIVVPLVGVVVLFMLIGVLTPFLLGRRKRGFRPGGYGTAGGAVCTRCGLPFSRHVLSPNILLGKLERCPHCGKWMIASAASRAELEAAEERLKSDSQRGRLQPEEDEREKLERMLDESRFD